MKKELSRRCQRPQFWDWCHHDLNESSSVNHTTLTWWRYFNIIFVSSKEEASIWAHRCQDKWTSLAMVAFIPVWPAMQTNSLLPLCDGQQYCWDNGKGQPVGKGRLTPSLSLMVLNTFIEGMVGESRWVRSADNASDAMQSSVWTTCFQHQNNVITVHFLLVLHAICAATCIFLGKLILLYGLDGFLCCWLFSYGLWLLSNHVLYHQEKCWWNDIRSACVIRLHALCQYSSGRAPLKCSMIILLHSCIAVLLILPIVHQ